MRHIRDVEETASFCRHAVSNGWRADRMPDRKGREAHSADHYRFSQGFLRRSRMGKRRSKWNVSFVAKTGHAAPSARPPAWSRWACVSTIAVGATMPSRPSQSAPQSIMIRAALCRTRRALCRQCRRERTLISPRVPRNVSSMGCSGRLFDPNPPTGPSPARRVGPSSPRGFRSWLLRSTTACWRPTRRFRAQCEPPSWDR